VFARVLLSLRRLLDYVPHANQSISPIDCQEVVHSPTFALATETTLANEAFRGCVAHSTPYVDSPGETTYDGSFRPACPLVALPAQRMSDKQERASLPPPLRAPLPRLSPKILGHVWAPTADHQPPQPLPPAHTASYPSSALPTAQHRLHIEIKAYQDRKGEVK